VRRLTLAVLLGLAGVAFDATPARLEPGAWPAPFEDALPEVPSVGERVEEIRRRVMEAVVYPEPARRHGIEGLTRIRFGVARTGLAEGIELVESSGHPVLDAAAERGARDARGLPWVFGRIEIPIRFSLDAR
jgi:protein TonB